MQLHDARILYCYGIVNPEAFCALELDRPVGARYASSEGKIDALLLGARPT